MDQLVLFLNSAVGLVTSISADTFNKVVLAVVAVFVMVIQWRMARKQMNLQEQIAKRQIEMQEQLATRQLETQKQIALRQATDNVSSKRQEWIDALRSDIAELLTTFGRIEELRRPRKGVSKEDEGKNFEELAAKTFRCGVLGTQVRLRLNPNEEDHIELVRRISILVGKTGGPKPDETAEEEKKLIAEFSEARVKVEQQVQVILKKEWERVKNGKL